LSRGLYHRPGSHVSNARINKRRLDANMDLDNVQVTNRRSWSSP
jgi:hypothetical protein